MNNMLKRIMFTLIIAIPIILIACNKSNVNKLNNNILKSSVQSIQEPNEISTEKESYNESYIEESNESRQSYDYKEESKIVNKNLLILGIDARGNEPARADTIILINMKNDRINFISIPRDTMITLGKRGKQKINASYAYGGVNMQESVEKLLDTKIHNYLVVNFKAIQKCGCVRRLYCNYQNHKIKIQS